MDTVQAGELVPIEATLLDGSLNPLTGKTDIKVSVRRLADGYFLDWYDMEFKSSGWTTRLMQMDEVDATLEPGDYRIDLDTDLLPQQDETYAITVNQYPDDDAANVPQKRHLKVIGPFR